MTHRQINFIGWILFIMPAIGFCIANIDSFGVMFGCTFFLVVYLALKAPFYRKEI